MANDNEPAKLLLPYLQRADELQKHEPLVAYYCRLYAMERGLRIPQNDRTKTTNAILVSLMKQLEKDKKSLKLAPDDSLHLEGFALNIFGKADKQDRTGRADLSTAKIFYAASIFFEVLNQFGELQPDIEQKQKYAAWKAADIRKAIKEGRKPVPGPPGGDQDLSTEYDLEPTQTDMDVKSEADPSPSPKSYNRVDYEHFQQIPPSPPQNTPPSTTTEDNSNNYSSYQPLPPPNTNAFDNPTADDYHPNNYFQPPPSGMGNSPYNSQEYPQQQQQTPFPNTYPNFQTYPNFTETSLPAAQSHHPSYYYQGSDTTSYSATSGIQYESIGRNGSGSHAASAPPPPPPAAVPTFQYDSNYQPPPEKIAEAHKAARFAVGALAFDDVSIAVDFLKKSLELLTNPSAGTKNPQKFPKKNGNKRRFGLLETIAKFVRPSGVIHLVKQQEVNEDMTVKKIDDSASGLLTLEEWILNSGISAKKVYPSMFEEYPQDSLSMEKAKNKVREN